MKATTSWYGDSRRDLLARLDPTIGSEIRKTRPCVVVSPNDVNNHLGTVVIVPMTSGSRPAAFRAPLRFDEKDGFILTEQIRTIDKSRLVKRLGHLPIETLRAVLRILRATYDD